MFLLPSFLFHHLLRYFRQFPPPSCRQSPSCPNLTHQPSNQTNRFIFRKLKNLKFTSLPFKKGGGLELWDPYCGLILVGFKKWFLITLYSKTIFKPYRISLKRCNCHLSKITKTQENSVWNLVAKTMVDKCTLWLFKHDKH